MSRLAVDPGVLAGAGVGLVGVGEGLGPAVSVVSAAFSANMGQDSAGVMFGRHYVEAGRGIMAAVAAGINALLRTGYGVGVSAVNYSRAEALSDLSGRAQPLALPPCPVGVVAAGGPSASGAGVAEPTLWAVVEVLVGDVWPSGSPAQMRIAAGAWRAFASVLHGISFEVSGPYNTVAAQEIPEPEGTPFATSSLPPASKDLPFYRYEVADPTKLLPGWRIEESLAAPWFHQPGGGIQFRIIAPPGTRPSVDSLIEMGYLREVRYGR